MPHSLIESLCQEYYVFSRRYCRGYSPGNAQIVVSNTSGKAPLCADLKAQEVNETLEFYLQNKTDIPTAEGGFVH